MNGREALADVVGPGLRVLFCGINPGLMSAATGHHFARPGNRFWPALHASGFTPRLLRPDEQDELLELGAKVLRLRPEWLAVVGITAYRVAFAEPKAVLGRQLRSIGTTGVWVLPNPSGLNAHHTPATLAAAFAELRVATSAGR